MKIYIFLLIMSILILLMVIIVYRFLPIWITKTGAQGATGPDGEDGIDGNRGIPGSTGFGFVTGQIYGYGPPLETPYTPLEAYEFGNGVYYQLAKTDPQANSFYPYSIYTTYVIRTGTEEEKAQPLSISLTAAVRTQNVIQTLIRKGQTGLPNLLKREAVVQTGSGIITWGPWYT